LLMGFPLMGKRERNSALYQQALKAMKCRARSLQKSRRSMSELTYEQFEEELEKVPYTPHDEDKAKWQVWYNKRVELSQLVKHYEIEGEQYTREPYECEDEEE